MSSEIDIDNLRQLHAATTTCVKWKAAEDAYGGVYIGDSIGIQCAYHVMEARGNASFIPVAHKIWPELLDELERLRASNKVLSDAYRAADIECGQLRARVSELSSGLAESIERRERRGCPQETGGEKIIHRMREFNEQLSVDNTEAIRDRLTQPFYGYQAGSLGATGYRLDENEKWEILSSGVWAFVPSCRMEWVPSRKYRLVGVTQ